MEFWVQLAGSAVAVAALVGVVAWANIARPAPPLDADSATALFAEEFGCDRPSEVWLAPDGLSAVAHAGDCALVAWRAGDGYRLREGGVLAPGGGEDRQRSLAPEAGRPRHPAAELLRAGGGLAAGPVDGGLRAAASMKSPKCPELARACGDPAFARFAGGGAKRSKSGFPHTRGKLGYRGVVIMNPLHAPFDPVTLATPFFILAVILEIVLSKLGKATAYYEPRDTAVSLSLGLGSTVAGVLLASVIFRRHRVGVGASRFHDPDDGMVGVGRDLPAGGLHLLLVPPAEP